MKPVWLVFAAAVVVYLFVRRRRLEKPSLIGGAVVAAGALVYGLGLVQMPNLETLLVRVGETLGAWTYVLVGALAFLETGAFVGLLAPGETAMLLGGLVAGQGKIELFPMLGIAWAAAVAGDLTSFFLGRRLGRGFMERHGPRVKITEARLESVEGFFDRHGGKAILLGRFVGLVRAVAPFLAGSSGMPLRRFVPYDVIGAGLWTSSLIVLGYVFWQSFSQVVDYAKTGALALGAVITLVVAIVWLVRWLRREENRARVREWVMRQRERPVVGPVVRVLEPVARGAEAPARFVWDRVTPGDLGLELTTLFAVAGVGAFAFVSALVRVDHGGVPGADGDALRLAHSLTVNLTVSIVKVVTYLGTFPVTAAIVIAGAAFLARRGDRLAPAVLVAGFVLSYAANHVAKAAVDRARPADRLVDTMGSSFPSGHATNAIAWVAVAIALARALPGPRSRLAFVGVGIAVALVVGLSRVYLRVHYLSDVVAGWGLGAAIYALCGVAALLVAHVRNNEVRSA
ncbi:MAG: bifunctional DedA family/phosphatase PAP2 family protein [Solirubrobacteraceae bacterium]